MSKLKKDSILSHTPLLALKIMTTPQDPRSIDAIIDSLDGGPAFPIPAVPTRHGSQSGMSLRDYFAGLALQGGLSSTETLRGAAMSVLRADKKITLEQMLAVRSYAFADAMLAARKENL